MLSALAARHAVCLALLRVCCWLEKRWVGIPRLILFFPPQPGLTDRQREGEGMRVWFVGMDSPQLGALWPLRFFLQRTMADLGCTLVLLTGPGSASFLFTGQLHSSVHLPSPSDWPGMLDKGTSPDCFTENLACSHLGGLFIGGERQHKINKESQEPRVALRTSRDSLQRKRASIQQLQATVKYYKWRQNTHLSSATFPVKY